MARSRFQVGLKRLGLPAIGERDIGDQRPGTVPGGVRGLSRIVLQDARTKVRRHTNVALRRISHALEEVDAVQESSPATSPATPKASQGILLRPHF